MKQMFRFLRCLILSLALCEVLMILGRASNTFFYLLEDHGQMLFILLFASIFYVDFIRKPLLADRTEYLVSTRPDICGSIQEAFDRRQYPKLRRDWSDFPNGLFSGIRTYRTQSGELLFTVCRGKFHIPYGRILSSILIIFIVFVPLSLCHALNTVHGAYAQKLFAQNEVTTPKLYPTLPEYQGDLSIFKLFQNTEEPSAAPTVTPEAPVEQPQEHPQEQHTDTQEQHTEPSEQETQEKTNWFSKIGRLFKNGADYVQGFFQKDAYLLPSDSRLLTEEDIAGMDNAMLQRCINELYARRGFDFRHSTNEDAASYFPQQSWYDPDPDLTMEDINAMFTEIEWANILFLSSHRS